MVNKTKILSDLSKMAVDAVSTFSGIKKEVNTIVRLRIDKTINKMKLVRRDEFEILKKMVQKLVLEKDKSVIGVFCDNAVTDHDGNLFDVCSYATTAALNSCKLPKYEMQDDLPVQIENETIDPPITTIPVSVTMARIGDYILVDPNMDEWSCLDARITITTNSDGNVVALQKGGPGGFTYDQQIKCAEISIQVGAKIREIIKEATKGSS